MGYKKKSVTKVLENEVDFEVSLEFLAVELKDWVTEYADYANLRFVVGHGYSGEYLDLVGDRLENDAEFLDRVNKEKKGKAVTRSRKMRQFEKLKDELFGG